MHRYRVGQGSRICDGWACLFLFFLLFAFFFFFLFCFVPFLSRSAFFQRGSHLTVPGHACVSRLGGAERALSSHVMFYSVLFSNHPTLVREHGFSPCDGAAVHVRGTRCSDRRRRRISRLVKLLDDKLHALFGEAALPTVEACAA